MKKINMKSIKELEEEYANESLMSYRKGHIIDHLPNIEKKERRKFLNFCYENLDLPFGTMLEEYNKTLE